MAVARTRKFLVRLTDAEVRHGRVVLGEDGALAAALVFAEACDGTFGAEAQVVVRDLETGVETCFRLDLGS